MEAGAPRSLTEDEMVARERQRVDSVVPGTDAVTIKHISKIYPGYPPKVGSRIRFCMASCCSATHIDDLNLAAKMASSRMALCSKRLSCFEVRTTFFISLLGAMFTAGSLHVCRWPSRTFVLQ